jgi:hypothetical protein
MLPTRPTAIRRASPRSSSFRARARSRLDPSSPLLPPRPAAARPLRRGEHPPPPLPPPAPRSATAARAARRRRSRCRTAGTPARARGRSHRRPGRATVAAGARARRWCGWSGRHQRDPGQRWHPPVRCPVATTNALPATRWPATSSSCGERKPACPRMSLIPARSKHSSRSSAAISSTIRRRRATIFA